MRVLVVSHTVFSKNENMGKTLSSYFAAFNSDELAQLYIHSQVPTSSICRQYFRITDKDALKSIFGFKIGKIFKEDDIREDLKDSRTDSGITASIYQKARKRTPLIYIARNLWWKLGKWNNKKLNSWIDTFNPDCVFLASGDYSFIYDIAYTIANKRNIPLVVSCMDDHYFYNVNQNFVLGKLQHKWFMKVVRRTMDYASVVFCICRKMSNDYSKLFGKDCITIHTASSIIKPLNIEKVPQISYLGNLGYKRNEQLISIGRALKKMNLGIEYIDVYSPEPRKEIIGEMCKKNGIRFHGAIEQEKVIKIIGESLAVIHTESFDEKCRQWVRYSVSTKIADSLASGTCIFAYGPKEIASIEYLEQEKAAICCTDERDLCTALLTLISDAEKRKHVVDNACNLAKANHSLDATPQIVKNTLANLVCNKDNCDIAKEKFR